MAVSRYAALTDAVLATLRALNATTLAGVEIVDGPPLLNQFPAEAIYVGWSGEPDSDTSGSISQGYHDLGPVATRDETAEVYCTIQAARGDDDMAAARLRAVAILGVMESALRANVSQGLVDVLRIEISDGAVRQVRNADGIGVEIAATVTATSLI
jgi:hypothetical protein